MFSPLLLSALTRPHRGTRPVSACCASLHSSLPPRPSPATYPPTLVKEAEVVYSPMRVSHRTRGLFCALKDLGLSVCSRRRPGMFANILVPLDGSALSEHALPMAQHLARSSDTALHLLQVISLRPELDALRGSGSESVTVLEMAQDAARRLREAQTARGQAYLEGLAVPLQHAGIHVTTALREGAADENILAYAQEHAIDLIIMSTHGYSGFK